MTDTSNERLREKNAELQRKVAHLTQRVEELVKAKRDLRDAREHLRLMLDALPDLLFDLDGQGRIRDFRAPHADALFTAPTSFLGKRFRDVLPAQVAEIVDAAVARAQDNGRDTGACYPLTMPSGERWFELSVAATTARKRSDHRTVVLVRDITMRRNAEEDLRRSERRYRLLSENTEDVIWLLDVGTLRFNYVSPSVRRLRGFTAEEVLQQTLEQVVAPSAYQLLREELPRRIALFEEGDESMRTMRSEVDQPCKDGSMVPTEVVTTLLVGADGRVTELLGVSRNVTERKKAEEARLAIERQLLHAQKLDSLGVLAGGVAHDFSNILTAILGNADLAQMELPPGSPARECLDDITTASRRAAELCRQMLAYSGKGRLVVEPVDVSQLVGAMTSLVEVSIPKKAVLQSRLAEGLPSIEADATQIRQIVMNLAVNAAEAIGDIPGTVSVTTGELTCRREDLLDAIPAGDPPPGRYVYIEVSDTGCGMDSATLARIFDPFFTTKFTGRGLGLPAVLGIVRGHNGVIKVKTAPGQGSSFRILFPSFERPVEADRPVPSSTAWRGSGTVLVVDDEEGVRKLAKAMLERLGFTVMLAADGMEAVDVFRAHADEIACVLLDLTMPRLDGAETFAELRKLKPGIRVVLSSGYLAEQATLDIASQDLAGFAHKPYQLSVLAEVFKRAFAWVPAKG